MQDFVKALGIDKVNSGACGKTWIKEPGGKVLDSVSPIDGKVIASVKQCAAEDYEKVAADAQEVYLKWRAVPAPKRGELVREIGNELRKHKEALGKLVTLEMGKIAVEGMGEVQEMIDMADFAVGLSRQLYGLGMHSERPQHRMTENWHPLGIVGVITAFNFPVAVWSWNAMIAAVCGDSMIWKPSSNTPLTALAVTKMVQPIAEAHGVPGLFGLAIGPGSVVGDRISGDKRIPLVSITGSDAMGRRVAARVGERLGRTILELGGNNGIIVMDDANLDLAVRAILFGAIGTAGQRCTSTRRIIAQKGVFGKLTEALTKAYKQVRIGDPLEPKTVMGPLVDTSAVEDMMAAIATIKEQGGEIVHGGNKLSGGEYPGGCYVEPTIVKAKPSMPIVKHETFAPVLYLMEVKDLDEAIAVHNDVPQGLSSAIFTDSLQAAERFTSGVGSDCGIANVNIGTSGAEIGGAFGGEKDTGGGREAGSDSWKQYMRRQTSTVNWSRELPLAQGIKFDI